VEERAQLAGRCRGRGYPALNRLFIAGTWLGVPAEYQVPGHVAEEVVCDIANWVLALSDHALFTALSISRRISAGLTHGVAPLAFYDPQSFIYDSGSLPRTNNGARHTRDAYPASLNARSVATRSNSSHGCQIRQ
jgi:hypothetical protein